MAKVIVELSTSLDGFIAGPNDGPENGLGDGGERLFKWYSSGDTEFSVPGTDMVFNISRASAELLQETWPLIGASVTGRHTFDIAGGWGGNPPGGPGAQYFVVTHNVPLEWARVLRSNASKPVCLTKYRSTWLRYCSVEVSTYLII
ncbi:MAG: hypothetical protein ACXW4U_16790 [Anaerolineales bacterium]